MTYLVAIILGFVEGATEFIPVSSSGHLIIARQFLRQNGSGGLAFDALLQLSATLAILVYFWKDIKELIVTFWNMLAKKPVDNKNTTLIWAIIFGTIPAILFGLLLESKMDTVFRNTKLVALTLVLGSILFWFAQKFSKENKVLNIKNGVLIGFFQCLALVPGISRSGATISGGLLLGLKKDEAVRYSFLLSVPILLGAGFKKLFEVRGELLSTSFALPLLLGSLVSFITAIFAINILIKYLKTHDLNVFIWYRVGLAILIFLYF